MPVKEYLKALIIFLILNLQKMESRIKKTNAGRKPVPDKKVQVSLYVLSSQIEEIGGIEKFKAALYEFAATSFQPAMK